MLRSKTFSQQIEIQLLQADITGVEAEAVVNPANSQLRHGGGLAAILAQKAGPSLQQESTAWIKKHGPVSHQSPAHTGAGKLPFKYIIHAVGPVWGSGSEAKKLRGAVLGSLQKAAELDLKSVALPAISTGVFGYPLKEAAGVILTAVQQFIRENDPSGLERILIVVYDDRSAKAFTQEWDQLFS